MQIDTLALIRGAMPVPLSTAVRRSVPLVGQMVHAGFPSPADDFIEKAVDLNETLIPNPVSTFLWRVEGDCMIGCRIFPGDVVIVDRSLAPRHGSVVVAIVGNAPTLKRLRRRNGVVTLHNENDALPPFVVEQGEEVVVWGVVTATIRDID